MNTRSALLLGSLVVFSSLSTKTYAGAQTEEEVRLELSYLAMRLLKITGEDSYTITSDAVTKPYLGVCSKMKPEGIYLACVTPGSAAEKAGFKTGDMMLSINGRSLANQSEHHNKKDNYWKLVASMKVGDQLKVVLKQNDEEKEVMVTVGSLSHPAYRLEVSTTVSRIE